MFHHSELVLMRLPLPILWIGKDEKCPSVESIKGSMWRIETGKERAEPMAQARQAHV